MPLLRKQLKWFKKVSGCEFKVVRQPTTRNLQPSTLRVSHFFSVYLCVTSNPKPETRISQPSTLRDSSFSSLYGCVTSNPKPETRNSQPLTFPNNNYLCPTIRHHVNKQNRHNLASFHVSFRE